MVRASYCLTARCQLLTKNEFLLMEGVVKKSRKIKLPGKMGKLLLPKNGDIDKLKERYPEDKFSLTSVITSDGKPLGFLLQKITDTEPLSKAIGKKKPAVKKKTAKT